MLPPQLSHRGFSLVEVTVALTIGAVLMSAALLTFSGGKYTLQETARRGQLARDAQVVVDMLTHDLTSFGAGVPQGVCLDGCSAATETLLPVMRRATSDGFAFVGDAPFPNSEFAGAALLTRFLGDADSASVALMADITGPCTPYASTASNAYQCNTSTTTPLAGTFTAADNCHSSQASARLCPWGLNKWQATGDTPVLLTFVDSVGNFYQRQWNGSTTAVDRHLGITVQSVSGGSTQLPRNNFYNPIGSGYVVNLDRILWSVQDESGGTCDSGDKCTVFRRQCWGQIVAPSAAAFPSTAETAFTTASTPVNCAAPDEGTEWEPIVTGVRDFELTYFGSGGTSLGNTVAVGDLGDVRSIELNMTLQTRVGSGPLLTHAVRQRFFMPNREVQ